jgi:hypothetical protein
MVRIWEERRDLEGARPTWRGSVDDLSTGTRSYFATLEDLVDYFRQHTGMPASAAPQMLQPRRTQG